jgi:hypothetical protein
MTDVATSRAPEAGAADTFKQLPSVEFEALIVESIAEIAHRWSFVVRSLAGMKRSEADALALRALDGLPFRKFVRAELVRASVAHQTALAAKRQEQTP